MLTTKYVVDTKNFKHFPDKLQVIGTSRNYSNQKKLDNKHDNNRFRMTHKININAVNSKKSKSQAVSPEGVKINKIQISKNGLKSTKRSLTYRNTQQINQVTPRSKILIKNSSYQIQEPKQRHNLFNLKRNIATTQNQSNGGRNGALNNHSPQKFKIKTSGLIMQTNPTSVQKIQKSGSKSKYVIHSTRKYSQIQQKRQTTKQKQSNDVIKHNTQELGQLTAFQNQQIKKYHVYFKGKRRIASKNAFTDDEGEPLIQIGDSIAYRYQVLQQLGKGAFGLVYKSKDHKKNQLVALKVIKSVPKLNKQAKIQISILQKAIKEDPQSKNNIVRMKSSFIFRGHTCITYQMLSINLYEYLKFNKFYSTPQPIIVKFSIQILHALNFLATSKIVHCDIKPQNIMLKQAHKTGLRLIDLGSSCFQQQQFYTYIQSRYYRAPEIILGIKYTAAIDMWSFGCVLAQLYNGYPLFPGQNQQQQLLMYIEILGYPPKSMIDLGARKKRFFNNNYQSIISQSSTKYRLPKGLTFQKALDNCQNKLFINFLKKCITWDPSKRITPKQALLDQWILEGMPPNIRARHIVQVTGQAIQF